MDFKYRAFLSYSHADTAKAKWLHKRLESFPLRALAGREMTLGQVPKELRPIFRDREDFSAGHSLTQQTLAALDASAALVVLCSPASAESAAVNEEVRLFKANYAHRPLVPLILDGAPGDPARECFPPALRLELNADGSVSDRPTIILAADLRETGDGRELALAKVVAALIGVPSDEVFRRAERERRLQGRLRAAIVVTILLLASAGGYLGWRSYTQEQTLTDIEALVNQYVPIGSAEAAQPGARERLRTAFESIAKGTATDPRSARALGLIKAGKPQEAEPLLKAAAEEEEAAGLQRIKQAAEKYRNLGAIAGYADPKRARKYYAKAAALDPADLTGMAWHAQMEWNAGNLIEAERAYKVVASNGVRGRDDHNLIWGNMGLGDIASARGSLAEALKAYRTAEEEAERLAKTEPSDVDWQGDLSVTYERVGNVLMARGDLANALKAYRDSFSIIERLAKADPGNAKWQRNLSISHKKVGDVLKAQGNLLDALKSFSDSLSIADRFAKADPNNARWQRELSVSYNDVGDVLVAQGNLQDALKFFRDSLAIRDRLAKADPNNARWQRELSVSYNDVGDVLVAQGNLQDALKFFRDSLAIRDRLAKADPNNAVCQRDLFISYNRVGSVLMARGDLPNALKAYRDSFSIIERLAKADPGNAKWQSDLAASHGGLGRLYVRLGDKEEARRMFERGRAIVAPLAEKSGHQLWIGYLKSFDEDIAALEKSPYQEAKEQIEAAFGAAEFSEAATLQAKLADTSEKSEREQEGKPGGATASALLDLSWYRLFARDFNGALEAADRADAIEPEHIIHATNKAHALMFLGRSEEARALYLRYKGQPVDKGGKLREAAILRDFQEFEKDGLTHPQMAEIKALLAPATPGR